MKLCVLCVILSLLKVGESAYLSFKKPTSSKSGNSEEATDGKDGIEEGCTHSVHGSTSSGEWLRVDLEKEYNITRVTVINRVEYENHHFVDNRLEGAEVKTSSEEDIESAEKCGESVTDTESSPIIDFLCQKGTRGRYVFIWNPRKEYLHICEMRVYNEDEPKINECRETESGDDYRGNVAITKNGRVCQQWTSKTPHSHSVVQDPDKGIGDHNLCRNPDGKAGGPWCYTNDADTELEYCDVGEVNEYCPLDSDDIANPIGIVVVNYAATICYLLSSDKYRSTTTFNINEISGCPTTAFTTDVFTSQSFTLGFHFYSDYNSVGDIVRLGNNDHYLTITQTVSDKQFYHSEVKVNYKDDVLTRAFVLPPNVWTFIGVTFDGNNKNIKLWRNGEIASIGYTSFTNLEFKHTIKTEFTDTGLAMVQVYDEVINEVAMKAARDLQFNMPKMKSRQQAAFLKKLARNERVHGQTVSKHTCRYLIQCSHLCLGNIFCEGFWFYTGRCTLLGCVQISKGKEDEILGTYYLKGHNQFI
ncbi:uncharacterized protein [Antedon mediterranea]|uniref:uncharacterized protein n=1 Tax=Antedon mediterranea TaxID=105859 RepID=UPI003AF8BB9E